MGILVIWDLDGFFFFYVKSDMNLLAKTGTKRKGFLRLKKSFTFQGKKCLGEGEHEFIRET